MKKTIEFYLNGKLHKSCPYSRWDKTHNSIIASLNKKGYVKVYTSENYKLKYRDCDVYVNPDKYECVVISTKIFTGYADKNGYKIYDEDTLRTPFGFDGEINQNWNSETYYVRKYFENSWKTCDYDIDDFSQYEKVKDVAGTPKKEWAKIEK